MAAESSLPMPDLAIDILRDRFGLDAEFELLCSTLPALYGRTSGLLMLKPVLFVVACSPATLLPDTALDRLVPVLMMPLGVAGESVPIRDLLFPDRGVTFVLNGETSSLAIAAMFGRVSRSGDSLEKVGEVWEEPPSVGVTGLFAARNRELRAGMSGFVDWPLLLC